MRWRRSGGGAVRRRIVAALASMLLLGLAAAVLAAPAPLGWVRNLQHDLHTLHFYSGPDNGRYTSATRAAVLRFQKAARISADGEWGTKSQAALDRMLHRRPTHPAKAVPLLWIRNLQRDLATLRLYRGPVNGLYTAATRSAVIRFQSDSHLVADGEWGVKSQAALDARLHRAG